MRISTKLSAVLATIFLTVGGIGALSVQSLSEARHEEVQHHAFTMAEAMANMAAFVGDSSTYQDTVDYFHEREQRDLEIVDGKLVILADVSKEDIGTRIEPGPRRTAIARTLRDGKPRVMVEAATGATPEFEQVVVPIRDAGRNIVAALVYEYTPLHKELTTQTEHSLRVVALMVLLGLLTALACAL